MKCLKVCAFHEDLFGTMLANPRLAKLIPEVFCECFESFPESALIAAIRCNDVDQNSLSFRLPAHALPEGMIDIKFSVYLGL